MGKKRLPKVQRNLNRKTYTDSLEKKYNIEVKFISIDQAKLHLRKENFIYQDWPWYFVNPFSLQGQFLGQTWDTYPQVDKDITDYHEFLLENNSLNEEQIDKLITILD